jgi:hypothetical protein
MHLAGGLFSDLSEGLEPPPAQGDGKGIAPPKPSLFPHVGEEELWTGAGRLFPAALTVLGHGI